MTGTIHGATFAIQSAISAKVTLSNGDSLAEVILSSTPDRCSDIAANIERASSQDVAIFIDDGGPHAPIAPTVTGAYTIAAQTGLSASFSALVSDAQCQDIASAEAFGSAGTVTLSTISGNVFAGHYDVTLDSGDHVTGNFDPEPCTALIASGVNDMCL